MNDVPVKTGIAPSMRVGMYAVNIHLQKITGVLSLALFILHTHK